VCGFKGSGCGTVCVVGRFEKQDVFSADSAIVGVRRLAERAGQCMVIDCITSRDEVLVVAGEFVFLFSK
jgi:hypothetical protein